MNFRCSWRLIVPSETVKQDKAAAIAYLRVRHKEGHWLLLVTSRSVVHSVRAPRFSCTDPSDGNISESSEGNDWHGGNRDPWAQSADEGCNCARSTRADTVPGSKPIRISRESLLP
jgi:hypothetical protein